jgi:hypothetical protein
VWLNLVSHKITLPLPLVTNLLYTPAQLTPRRPHAWRQNPE